ncbi:MAG: hypothetical protein ACYTEZ_01060 [Planctomycetota bacterium]|jgi:hypothetical protein
MKLRWMLLALLASAAVAQEAKPQVIDLRDGGKIFGVVLPGECTEESLVIRDRRSGGKRTIAWGQVEAETARKLRIELGYEVAEPGDILRVQGHELTNRAGKVFLGLVLNPETAEKDGFYHLKTSERDYKILFKDVPVPPESVELDALAVYTPTEIYEQRIAQNPPTDVVGHFRTAEFARLVGALEEAKKHYEKVLSYGETQYRVEKIRRQIERVEKLLGMQEARGELRRIKQAIIFNRFDQAQELIEAFQAKYTDEVLLKDLAELEEERKLQHTRFHVAQVARRIPRVVKDLLQRKLKEEELTLSEGMRYAGGQTTAKDSLSAHAVEQVAADVGVSKEEAQEFWSQRPKRTIKSAFFRDGSFIVIPNLPDPLDRAPKIKEPKGAKGQKVNLPKPRPPLTPDRWWELKRQNKKTRDLRDFLFAYWVEESGLCEVLDPKKDTCPTCHAKGYVVQLITTPQGSAPFVDRCGTCHGALHFRVVRWK